MLWIVKDEASYAIIACNVHEKNGLHELWITRTNDKNLKLEESADINEILTIKEAIDYAIETGERCLRLTA